MLDVPESVGNDEVAAIADGLAILLRQRPDAHVVALNAEGVRVPMPASVPLAGHEVVEVDAGTQLAAPRDLAKLIQVWEQAKIRGASQSQLTYRDGSRVHMHLFDVRTAHGVFVVVVTPDGGADEDTDVGAEETGVLRTSVCRIRKDELSTILGVDDAARELYGWTREEMVGKASREFTHPDDFELSVEAWMNMVAQPGATACARIRQRRADGTYVWVDMINHNRLDDPELACIVSDVVDVTEEVAAQEALRNRERLLHRVMEALPSGLVHLDVDEQVVHANDRVFELLGSATVASASELFAQLVTDDRQTVAAAITSACASGHDDDLEVRLDAADGGVQRILQLAIRSVSDHAGTVVGAVVSVVDVTEMARRRQELEVKATFDPLTHCHNRESIMAALETAIHDDDADRRGTAVLFIDLDRFKPVNDRLGHAAGDELLRTVAARVRATVRTGDLVGRIGGDEFLVVCPDLDDADHALSVAQRVVQVVAEPIVLNGEVVRPAASVGIAWTTGESSPDEVVAQADTAMYEAKRAGGKEPVLREVG